MSGPDRAATWELHPYRLPLARPYAWARGTHTQREGALVRVGEGWGEIAFPPGEPFDEAGVRQQVHRFLADEGAHVSSRVRCGVSTAILDAQARDQGRSVAALLAALLATDRPPRPSVRVNALVVGDAAQAVQAVQGAAQQGIDVLKLKLTSDRQANIVQVALVREAAPDATLRLDANGSWDRAWAAAHMEELAPFGIDYVEQPLPAGQEDALRTLQAHAPFDIAIDESATDAQAVRDALQTGVARVAILKPQRLGGLAATLAAAEAARDAGGRAIVTNSLETSVGVRAALHAASLLPADEACGLATSGFFARDVASPPMIRDGRMEVPRGAGLGIEPEVAQCGWP